MDFHALGASDSASETWSDAELIARFERQDISRDAWTHRAHVRTAWNYLRSRNFDDACERVADGIAKLNSANGIDPALFHLSVTIAWLRLVADAAKRFGAHQSSIEFLAENPHFNSSRLLRLFYSTALIESDEARLSFVQGDITVLPGATERDRKLASSE